jgi:hypothetical protein
MDDIQAAMAEIVTFVHNSERADLAAVNNSKILGRIGLIRRSGALGSCIHSWYVRSISARAAAVVS